MTSVRVNGLVFVVVTAFAAGDAFAFDWSDLWQRPDQRAYELLQQGDSTSAAQQFSDPQWRGVSHYRAGEFEQAQKEFSDMEGDTALYNQGVTAVQQGEFDTAVEHFETLVNRSPDHEDGQHNLDIARELAKQQEQQEQQQGDQGDPQEDGDPSQEDQQQDQSGSEAEGEEGESEPADGESGDQQGDAESSEEQRGGELAAEPDDAASDSQDEQPQSGDEGLQPPESEQQSQQNGGQDAGADQEVQATPTGSPGPTESEQATEQWLRRIPDDPSQLLRNKIKLNHMIEHADVQDMQEPW